CGWRSNGQTLPPCGLGAALRLSFQRCSHLVAFRRSIQPDSELLDRQRYDGILDLLRHAVLQHRLLAADFLQGSFAALVAELLEPVEAFAAVAHHLAGFAYLAELLCEVQPSTLC